jgi:hypothetical protein
MLEVRVQTKFDRIQRFIKEHPTFCACLATAIVTHRVTYIRTYRGTLQGVLQEATEAVYNWGHRAGEDGARVALLYEFLAQKGLMEEYEQRLWWPSSQ